MTTRKRWIVAGAILALLCLVCGGLAFVYVARTAPGVARLLHGAVNEPTAIPLGANGPSYLLPTVTLTPLPSRAAPEVPPSPTATPPSMVRVTQPVTPIELVPSPSATSTATATPAPAWTATPAPTWTATPAPTWTVSPTPRPPTVIPRPQWIAFESQRGANSDYEIVAMMPDGSRVTNLTQSWADDVSPIWSPDGLRIAFVTLRDTPAGKWGLGPGSIYLMDFDPLNGAAGSLYRLTDGTGDDGWPTWSPDGRQIAFESDRGGDREIWIIHTDGFKLTRLTYSPGEDNHPDWAPDGTRIAFTSARGGGKDIWVMNADGSDPANLTQSPGRDRYPMWSPDAKRIAFNTSRDGNQEIYVMNADGSDPTNVSRSPASIEGLADWSPDGQRLVFYSDRSGNKEVYILDLASLAWANISNNPASDEFCTWSP